MPVRSHLFNPGEYMSRLVARAAVDDEGALRLDVDVEQLGLEEGDEAMAEIVVGAGDVEEVNP